MTSLLYGANKPLTSGPGLFGADALGENSGFGGNTGGGMFDDDEEDNFLTSKKPANQPQQTADKGLFGAEDSDEDYGLKANKPKKKLGFLGDDDDDDDTFVP